MGFRKKSLYTLLWLLFGVGLSLCGAPVSGQADDRNTVAVQAEEEASALLTAQEDPWGRFAPQSWTCMQTLTWTIQNGQKVVSIRDTKTTLESVDRDGVTLKKVAMVNIGDRRIETGPSLVRFDFFHEPIRDNVRITDGGSGKLVINTANNLIIPCKKRIYEQESATEKNVTVTWYSTQLYPYVLRVESTRTRLPTAEDPEERVLRKSVSEVLESSSFHLRGSKFGTYRTRTWKTEGTMTTITEAACSRHVPGGLVHESIRDFDAQGTEIRTVENKLINYYCGAPRNEVPTISPEETPYFYPPIPLRPRWRRFYALPPY